MKVPVIIIQYIPNDSYCMCVMNLIYGASFTETLVKSFLASMNIMQRMIKMISYHIYFLPQIIPRQNMKSWVVLI